jgi:hypothetical protein
MLFGEGIDRRGDPCGIETVIRPGAVPTLSMVSPITDGAEAVTADCMATVVLCWIPIRFGKAVLAAPHRRYVFSRCVAT